MLNLQPAYIVIAIGVLLIIAILVFVIKKGKVKKITPLASLAFAFVIAGVIFSDDRLIGYSLMGIGIVLAILDIILIKSKSKRKKKR